MTTESPKADAAEARSSPRGAQLKKVEEAIHADGLDEWRALLIRASDGMVVDRDQTAEAMRRVGAALPKARWELEWALAYPEPSTPEIDAALRDDWSHVIFEIQRTELADRLHGLLVLAKHYGKSDAGSYEEAERLVAEHVRRVREAVREAPAIQVVHRARATKRGLQLRLVELVLNEQRVHSCLTLLADLSRGLHFGLPLPVREHVQKALKTVEPALLEARHLHAKMTREPEPSDPETSATLEPLWDELLRDLERADEDVEAAKAWLASKG